MTLYAFAAERELVAAEELHREGSYTAFAIMMMDRRRKWRGGKGTVGEAVRGIEHYVFVECTEPQVFQIKRKFPMVRPVIHSNGRCYPLADRARQMLWNKRALWLNPQAPLLHDTDQAQAMELDKARRNTDAVLKGQKVEFSLLNRRFTTEVLQTRMETAHDGPTLFLKLEVLGRMLWLPAEEVTVQRLEKAA